MIYTLLSWAPATLWAATLFVLSSMQTVPGTGFLPFNDKVAHVLAYTALGAALAWGGLRTRARTGPRTGRPTSARSSSPLVRALASPPVLVILGALFAASDEWHQSFVPGRDPSVGDFTADMAGIVAGLVVVRALTRRRSEEKL